jgi:glyoxylase-like metal-dependent hydrolase (beta-lactamase superfamily II)
MLVDDTVVYQRGKARCRPGAAVLQAHLVEGRRAMAEVIQYTLGMSNGFFVKDDGFVAVDCGSELGVEPFLGVCAESGVEPKDIRLLVVTHGHVDHFVNMGEMRTATGAPIMCHKNAERSMREARFPEVRPRSGFQPVPVLCPIAPDLVVSGTVDLGPWGIGGRLVETPGHSDSCMSMVLDSGQALVGDLVVEDPRDHSASLAYFCCTDDMAAADRQIFLSVEYLLKSAATFFSGHGGPFTKADVARALKAAQAEAGWCVDGAERKESV